MNSNSIQDKIHRLSEALSVLLVDLPEAERDVLLNDPMRQSLLEHFSFPVPSLLSDTSSSLSESSPLTRGDIVFSDYDECIPEIHPDWGKAALDYLFAFRQTYLDCRERLIRTFLVTWNQERELFNKQSNILPFGSGLVQDVDLKMKNALDEQLVILQRQALVQLRDDLKRLFAKDQETVGCFL